MATRLTVVVIGAGPGGLAAAQHLAAANCVRTVIVTRAGQAVYLPGILPVLLGFGTPAEYTFPLPLTGPSGHAAIEVVAGEVIAVEQGRIQLADGTRLAADAVIAAPGLTTLTEAVPQSAASYSVWELDLAERARSAIQRLERGHVVVAATALPYRCPPAPYGLALALAAYYREAGRAVQVTVLTPEARPLAALGEAATRYMERLLEDGEVRLHAGSHLERTASRDRVLVDADGENVAYDLGLFIPPHARPTWLAHLAETEPLVPVDAHLHTAQAGLWVVGDAAKTGLPRAAGVAEAQGQTAAASVLADLGLTPPALPVTPHPSCYLWSGTAQAGRIQLRFPSGPPPEGHPEVSLEPPNASLSSLRR